VGTLQVGYLMGLMLSCAWARIRISGGSLAADGPTPQTNDT
jgi:hypothetical protein